MQSVMGDERSSYQKLESYLKFVAMDNPGSFYRVEAQAINGTSNGEYQFTRSILIPSACIDAAYKCIPMLALDGKI